MKANLFVTGANCADILFVKLVYCNIQNDTNHVQ